MAICHEISHAEASWMKRQMSSRSQTSNSYLDLFKKKQTSTNSLDLYDASEIFLEGVFQSPRLTWA